VYNKRNNRHEHPPLLLVTIPPYLRNTAILRIFRLELIRNTYDGRAVKTTKNRTRITFYSILQNSDRSLTSLLSKSRDLRKQKSKQIKTRMSGITNSLNNPFRVNRKKTSGVLYRAPVIYRRPGAETWSRRVARTTKFNR